MTKRFRVFLCLDESTAECLRQFPATEYGMLRLLGRVQPQGMSLATNVFGGATTQETRILKVCRHGAANDGGAKWGESSSSAIESCDFGELLPGDFSG
jgi:hypothetical protein